MCRYGINSFIHTYIERGIAMDSTGRPRIGLFSGGIEQYWTECGMKDLPKAMKRDIGRLKERLEDHCEVIFPLFVANARDARKAGKTFLEQDVDMVLMYHATYIDDQMTVAMIDEIRGIFPVLFLSQGMGGIPDDIGLVESGTCWGVNSSAQLPGSFKRMWPGFRHGFVFGHLESDRAIAEVVRYGRAAHCVKNLRGKVVGFLPHRSAGVPMYDTFPDEARMMGQTGIELRYLYIYDLVEGMKAVSDEEATSLTEQLYRQCEVVEPPREEVHLAARQAIALERLVERSGIDALAIDMFPGLTPICGMIPCVGMARLIDRGIVVATEGDLSVSVAGLIVRELCGKPIHFWEHLMFDEEKNWILGGHEGGCAGFSMAKEGTRPKLRSTQYIDFSGLPGAPRLGVLPEFITNPGPVTLLTLFRGEGGYEMRLARGKSVDTHPREVHFEHTIFEPNIPIRDYFHRVNSSGVCHHFALVHDEIGDEVEKVAEILGMKLELLTD
jgi:L-fucose isomerase-like protein